MKEEVDSFDAKNNWKLLHRSKLPQGASTVLPAVWQMKHKRRIATQDIYKWKACLNLDGWKQADKGHQLLGDICPSDIVTNNPSAPYYGSLSRLAAHQVAQFRARLYRSPSRDRQSLHASPSRLSCLRGAVSDNDLSKPDGYGTSILCPS